MALTVSVVVPNYNHERYLPVSLGALAAQAAEALEIIVVDDGSKDGSVAVIEKFCREVPNMRLIRHERNRGLTAAWNTGVNEAKGDFVTIPGADDAVLPGFLAKSRAALERHPEAGLCTARAKLIGPAGEDLGSYHTAEISAMERFIAPEDLVPLYKEHGNWFVTQTMVYRRADVLAQGGWQEKLAPACDGILAWLATYNRGAVYIPEELAVWRKLPTSAAATASADAARMLEAFRREADALAKPRAGKGLPPEFLAELWRRSLIVGVGELLERPGFDPRGLRPLLEALPDPGACGRLALASVDTAAARAAAKLLIFSREPCSRKARLVARKLKRLAGLPA